MKNHPNKALILFFIKYPEPGAVKTRLAAVIGNENAVRLYRNFILDTLMKLESLGIPFKICYFPREKRKHLIDWLGEKYQYYHQRGDELGERMEIAFSDTFSDGYNRAILIGSDFPDLPTFFFKEALDALNTHDSVLGPALDGGYYLIGFRDNMFSPGVFRGMEWGMETVFRETLTKLRDHKKRVYILPPWNDVDTIEDLQSLVNRSRATDFSNSQTISFFSKMKKK
ncbi:MAG: TIGR04282 family arsenosugar biosynthesis glycosyltransferase [Pseudomonadota bacterium]